MKKLLSPMVSKYKCARGVYKLSLNAAFLQVVRDQGMILEGGMRCNVVSGNTDLSIEINYDTTGKNIGKYLLSSVGRSGILQLNSKDFHACAEHYTISKVYAPNTDPSVGPTATGVICTALVDAVCIPSVKLRDSMTDDLREQVNKLDESILLLRKAIRGMMPTATVLRCEDCYCKPDTDSYYGWVACCGNLETYVDWNKLQNKKAKERGRWAATYKDA